MSSKQKKTLVVAVDIGIDYSTYGFSFRHEYQKHPTNIYFPSAFSCGSLSSSMQPTCVLCNPAGQFHSFGYEAEDKYTELSKVKEHYNWYFFQKFNNMLPDKEVNMGFELTDEKGLKMPALKVFSMVISYWKELTLHHLDMQGTGVRVDEIHWVLSVPATWTSSANEFLRQGAKEAGIDGANLTIALEPHAAAVYCEAVPSDHLLCGRKFDDVKYIVIDLGDSQSVFTVHEKQPNGTIQDVSVASCGPWGSIKIDEEFAQLIIKIFGAITFKALYNNCRADYLDIIRDLDVKKRYISSDSNNRISIRIPRALERIYNENTGERVQDAVEQSPFRGKIQLSIDRMRFDAELFRSLFKNYISSITNHIENICEKAEVKGTSTFLMIGKLSECPLVQESVIQAFPKAKVVIPKETYLAVLKGAVILGHKIGLTCDYNFQLQEPTNKDHSAVATTFAPSFTG